MPMRRFSPRWRSDFARVVSRSTRCCSCSGVGRWASPCKSRCRRHRPSTARAPGFCGQAPSSRGGRRPVAPGLHDGRNFSSIGFLATMASCRMHRAPGECVPPVARCIQVTRSIAFLMGPLSIRSSRWFAPGVPRGFFRERRGRRCGSSGLPVSICACAGESSVRDFPRAKPRQFSRSERDALQRAPFVAAMAWP